MEKSSPSLWQAIKRGLRCKCPSCGKTSAFRAYLKVQDNCATCNTQLSHFRSDDLPPYITIFLVGHIVVPLLLIVEEMAPMPMATLITGALIATGVLTLALLPIIKGAVIALMWHLDRDGSLYN